MVLNMQHQWRFALLALVPAILLLASTLAELLVEVPVGDELSPLDQILDGLEVALPAFKGSVRGIVEDLAVSQTSTTAVSSVSPSCSWRGLWCARTRHQHHAWNSTATAFYWNPASIGWHDACHSTEPVSVANYHLSWTQINGRFGARPAHAWLLSNPLTEFTIQLGVTAAGFYVLVRIIATEKFGRVERWIGAFMFALLFLGSRVGLDFYLTTTPLQQVYGTAMAFIGLILWLYVSSLLLLIGSSVIHGAHTEKLTQPCRESFSP